jgi:hypothetical protein
MEQPPGFVAQGEYRGSVCKLKGGIIWALSSHREAWFTLENSLK